MKPEVTARKLRLGASYAYPPACGGTPERPRLNVFRSLSHIYVQVIDDSAGVTLASASTVDRDVRDQIAGLEEE